MFGWGKKKKEKKKAEDAGKGVKPWDEGKARNEKYSRSTGHNTHSILEAQRMGRGGGTPSHYLRKKRR